MENEELIREDMERTRESLTEKLETLEKKLVDTVHGATSAVKDTVEGATSAVKETMSSVKETMHDGVETVKEAVDIPAHVERQPWLMFGGSVLAGYLLGTLLEGRREPNALPPPQTQPLKSTHQHGNGHSKREKRETPAPAAPKESWFAMLEPEVNHIKGLALGVALGTVREMLTEQVPPHLAGELRGVIDAVTKKVGGEPLPATDFQFAKSKETCSTQEPTPGAFTPEQPRF